jgi:DNA-binding Lrp family transcriptional regulator
MSDMDLSELDARVLAALKRGFPVSQSPYCDIAAELGVSEIEVLNSAGKLRETGAIARIVAVFPNAEAMLNGRFEESADLAQILSFDLPWSEHPYAEVAAQLELRGIEIDEAQIIARIREWLSAGIVSEVVALTD